MNKPLLQTGLVTLVFILLAAFIPSLSKPFQQAFPGYRYQFPKDHGAHEAMKTEWWYYTGHLQHDSGKSFGYELTFFRIGQDPDNLPNDSKWALKNIYMTHFALSDENTGTFYNTERINRAGLGLAGAQSDTYHVWNKDWSVALMDDKTHHLQATHNDFEINLSLLADRSPTIHGINGISQKADCKGCASHYYSYTRMPSSGRVRVGQRTYTVTGQSWMDHEFGSNQLTPEQVGWDWFSLQLDDNTDVMLYAMRHRNGQLDPNSSGTIVLKNGQDSHLKRNDFKIRATEQWKSPKTGGQYPSGWQVTIPSENLTLSVSPTFKNQELVFGEGRPAYWEGSVAITGKRDKRPITGKGYVELTGYAKPFNQRL